MKFFPRILFVAFFSIIASFPALAAGNEPPAITALFEALQRQYSQFNSGNAKYDKITPDGDGGATLEGVTTNFSTPEVSIAMKIGKVIISGVSENSNGTYSFESIKIMDTSMTMMLPDVGPVTMTVPVSDLSGVHLLKAGSKEEPDFTSLLGTAVFESSVTPVLTITVADQSFDAKNYVTKWQGDPLTGFGKWDMSIEQVIVPVASIPNPAFQKDMKESFGFESFDLSFDGSMAIKGTPSKADIAYALRFTGKKIGSLELAFSVLDIPARLMEVLKEAQRGGKPNMSKIMPLVMALKLENFKLRFVDDDFAEKMFEFAAKKQGMPVETFKANGAAMIQLGLAQAQSPEFTKTVVEAYQAFVKNPKNIMAEISPAAPVAFATIMGLMQSPAAAITTLGVKVTANQ